MVVPVKQLVSAKTRFAFGSQEFRSGLALAFAQDVVAACLAAALVEDVVVVSDDLLAVERLSAMGARCIPDPQHLRSAVDKSALNRAVECGATFARTNLTNQATAVIAGDLPTIQSGDLTALLGCAAGHPRGFVADHLGTGTTILVVNSGAELDPKFGANSATAHSLSGASDLTGFASPTLRLDVDTSADLKAAMALTVGPHTLEMVTNSVSLPQPN